MNTNIKVSIITPSYNQGEFIEQTIQSVLNQTYKNIEYIIVDGGSTDYTLEIIDRYRDQIDVVISEKDKGQSDAINKGFKQATGELAGWINSDDLLYPDCVEKIVELYHRYPDGSIYYPAVLDFIDSEGKLLYKSTRKIPNRNHLLNRNYSVIQQGSFYNRHLVKQIGYLDESVYYCMDLDLWLRLLNENGKIYYYQSHALAAFRMWENTKTTQAGIRFLQNTKQILDRQGAKKISQAKFHLFYMACRILAGKVKHRITKK
jgi:glycosyltransferase involved in cell wall biosynthesis